MTDDPARGIVAGDRLSTSVATLLRSIAVLIEDEQRKPSPDSRLVGVLCDAVRFVREVDYGRPPLIDVPETVPVPGLEEDPAEPSAPLGPIDSRVSSAQAHLRLRGTYGPNGRRRAWRGNVVISLSPNARRPVAAVTDLVLEGDPDAAASRAVSRRIARLAETGKFGPRRMHLAKLIMSRRLLPAP